MLIFFEHIWDIIADLIVITKRVPWLCVMQLKLIVCTYVKVTWGRRGLLAHFSLIYTFGNSEYFLFYSFARRPFSPCCCLFTPPLKKTIAKLHFPSINNSIFSPMYIWVKVSISRLLFFLSLSLSSHCAKATIKLHNFYSLICVSLTCS